MSQKEIIAKLNAFCKLYKNDQNKILPDEINCVGCGYFLCRSCARLDREKTEMEIIEK